MPQLFHGKIIRGVGGFYYVCREDGLIYACKARGLFRKDKIKPLPGDDAEFFVTDETDMEGSILRILPRKNSLIRPEIANADQTLVIFAVRRPEPNLALLDRLLIEVEKKQLDPVICFNKTDLAAPGDIERLKSIYRDAGYQMYFISCATGEGIDELGQCLAHKTTVLMGNSGVGKSTLINLLCPQAQMETGAISEKLKRGRHTTRHTELFYLSEDTFLMDTPGFSAMELLLDDAVDLRFYYKEFDPWYPQCRFNDCTHTEEKDCAVRAAVERGEISRERYEQYKEIYLEIKNRKKY
ncbi:MAG: ribosome small subunit-dependent GTPase A [Lachnospiraceae bacterium]|nr:ribosome small subunit-dependent GTPase A [Lachnospiraceae bacterium]